MRSTKPKEVKISKVSTQGTLPPFLDLIVRHYEKSVPIVTNDKQATLVAPLDLLSILIPGSMLATIASIEIEFKKKDK